MIDPRENTIHDPREELKEKLKDCGYPISFTELPNIPNHIMVKFDLPKGPLYITMKQAAKQSMANIKALIDAAMNQDKIIASLPKPSADRESDIE